MSLTAQISIVRTALFKQLIYENFVQDSAPASPTYSPLVERELHFFLAVGVDRARRHDGGIVDGAGDRTRTGKPVKAADFRHTASFEAAVV
ncbi:hypothetical protein [Burkholderia dolosa]|uniref:hypothetical protein n=1 Tax=Burkholderia dolosa TaxID=152500 RepID=UPI001591327D|nr:hypothetical protein [Burkholderia dolosa]MBR8460099.1 hypothetical protein [Burkholderia dolosa]MBY4752465.1 hypothetical protein [Burkholderia dolosa]MDN7423691.1 hypothetical protein [Burkholderia dolosa]